MPSLRLERPLVFFDLETTGIDPASDRIVEICILRLEPDGSREIKTRRINPQRPIPPGATAVHGITDADVAEAPTFRQVARSLLDLLAGADLAGFNVARFDIPLLDREFRDCEMDLELASRKVVDSMTIFHRKEPRNLSAAVRFYLDRDHEGAHAAEADVLATADILEAQLARYEDLPETAAEIEGWLRGGSDRVDDMGKFLWRDGEVVVAFGKHQGKPLRDVVTEAPSYLAWVLKSDFPTEAKQIVENALRGELPAPP